MRTVTAVILIVLLASPGSMACTTAGIPAAAEQSDIDSLVAPVALYPDALLSQMLICAMDTTSLKRLDDWLKMQSLKGSDLQDAAVLANFEPSFVALTVFPQVVSSMVATMDRTKLLGEAFAANKSAVFAAIQKLRAQAQKVGTLKSTPQQQVETQTTSSGEQVIVIEPTNPQVIYVPQYNPTVVYTTAPTTTTVVVEQTSSADAVAAGMIGFTAGIAIGAAVNNSYYYGPYGWYGGGYMYNDAWDDYWDHREDAREDWQDHREDLNENRSERREDLSEQRSDRAGERSERAQSGQQQRTERQENRASSGTQRATQQSAGTQQRTTQQSAGTQQRTSTSNYESRGKTTSTQRATQQQTGTRSDAFSGYSSGTSQRAASSRGQSSRGGSRGGGGRRR